jgi:S-adenosylmethionine:tRNA ribosyltransferase-isomerase
MPMNLDELGYHLPVERIAQCALERRDASRMLLLRREGGGWEDHNFREFPDLLRGDALMVLNNARVLPARLFGRRLGQRAQQPGVHSRARGEFLKAEIEVLLLRAIEPLLWEALVRPGRKVGLGETIVFGEGELQAEVIERGQYGLRQLRFKAQGDFRALVERLGHIPLPPYIRREDVPSDRERYQTIFASRDGAVAAPTAGLHFTREILEALDHLGIQRCELTLEVGLGTFEPVRTTRIEDHPIHRETYDIPQPTAAAIATAQREGRPILAIGTTVVRALEDSAEKLASLVHAGAAPAGPVIPGRAEAEILLYPGKHFRVVDQLLTNFHLPRSSLLAMVAGFAGKENILRAYAHAVKAEYRFYSYGDCMFIR